MLWRCTLAFLRSLPLVDSSAELGAANMAHNALIQLCDELFSHIGSNLDETLRSNLCKQITAGMTRREAAKAFALHIEEWFEAGTAPPALQVYMNLHCSDYESYGESEKHKCLRDFLRLGQSLDEFCDWSSE